MPADKPVSLMATMTISSPLGDGGPSCDTGMCSSKAANVCSAWYAT